MSEITASEQIRLDIIKKVNYDTAAAKLAIDWVLPLNRAQLILPNMMHTAKNFRRLVGKSLAKHKPSARL